MIYEISLFGKNYDIIQMYQDNYQIKHVHQSFHQTTKWSEVKLGYNSLLLYQISSGRTKHGLMDKSRISCTMIAIYTLSYKR